MFGIVLVIFFFMHFQSDHSSMVQDQSYIFHQWVHIKCRFTAKKRFQKLLDLVFFNNFFFEIFRIFLVIFFFMHFHSDYSSMVQDQSYIFHQWVHIKCRFTAKKRFQKLLDLVFFNNFFFLIFRIFLFLFFFMHFQSDYSSMVQDQSYIFHQWVSYQVPFYSEKAISEIVRLIFF